MRYFILIFFLTIRITSNAQFSVNIGADTTYCSGLRLYEPDTFYIGENVIIDGGTEPYSYSWSCEARPTDNLGFYASDFLNDTTLQNPYFIDTYFNNEWVTFTLEVVDAAGNKSSDSIQIRFSRFGYHLNYFQERINEGDSVQFKGVALISGGIKPLSYYWYPPYFLSDSTDLAAYAYPDSTTEYSLYTIDSLGCKSDTVPFYNIIVDKTSVAESVNEDKNYIKVINGQNEIKIYCQDYLLMDKKKGISVYTIDGKILISDMFPDQEYTISKASLNYKIVVINISFKNKSLFKSKVFLY